jgi:hypothetical protein
VIVAHKADYLFGLKGNQPTLEGDVERYSADAPESELATKTTIEKGHGRIETRTYTASSNVDWIVSDRHYPGKPRFANIKTIVRVYARAEYPDRRSFDTRYFISSAARDIERISAATRDHWGIESMHWLLDVEFNDDLSRYRTGHGAKNMAAVRRFALGLVRANKSKAAGRRDVAADGAAAAAGGEPQRPQAALRLEIGLQPIIKSGRGRHALGACTDPLVRARTISA